MRRLFCFFCSFYLQLVEQQTSGTPDLGGQKLPPALKPELQTSGTPDLTVEIMEAAVPDNTAKLNLDLALVAGTCLVLITAVAATIKNSAISDD